MFEALTPAASADGTVALALADGPSERSVSLLCSVQRKQLTQAGRLDYIRAWEQVSAWALAQQLPAIVDHVGSERITGDGNTRSENLSFLEQQASVEEIRLTLALSPVATSDRVEAAQQLCGPMHRTYTELANGRMTFSHALAAVDSVRTLHPGKIADITDVEVRAISRAGHKPVGDFRRALRGAIDAIDPTATARRHRQAKKDRCVRRWPLPDGMACLSVEAPAPDIEAIHGALSVLAGRPGPDDDRSVDARRCDALLGLCLAAVAPAPPLASTSPGREPPLRARPKVPVEAQVVIDLATLLGLAENNCVLSGYGEIPAGMAREWLHEATTWRRLVVDPIGGHLLDYGPVVRTAPNKLRDFPKARHQTCTFPQCNRRATNTDMDHQPEWLPHGQGGRASARQMRPLCRRHHNLKTFTGWTREQALPDMPAGAAVDQDDGWTRWQGPAGRSWDLPPPRILEDD